jgi:carboxypeptidase Taq
MDDKLNELKKRLGQVHDLERAAALLNWDLQTYMPSGGTTARSHQSATLSRLAHEQFTSDEIGRWLEDLEAATRHQPYEDDTVSLLRVTRREYDKARRVPGELVHELAQTEGLAMPAWARARAESDFGLFAPHLEKILELKRQEANYLGYRDRMYDALLDLYEPGMKTAQLQAIFDEVRKELVPLVRAISERADWVDGSILEGEYDEQKQWDLSLEALRLIGFSFENGRQDKSVHPFTTSFSNRDVRVTTRLSREYFPMAFFSTLHEGGHGLYEQGSPEKFQRTPLAGGASLGVHESQSRLWENLVGRSRPFWQFFFPRFCDTFPEAANGADQEAIYRAVNRVQPSPIRVEADEVTYNLHIMLRFQMENALLEEKLAVRDVPEAWNAAMQEFLGIIPSTVAEGVLQDIHWSIGSVGYFPTYSLGTFFSVQLFDKARADMPDLDTQFQRGDFSALLGWLREHVHQHGRKFTLNELAIRICDEPLQTRSYLRYLKDKFGEIYDL